MFIDLLSHPCFSGMGSLLTPMPQQFLLAIRLVAGPQLAMALPHDCLHILIVPAKLLLSILSESFLSNPLPREDFFG